VGIGGTGDDYGAGVSSDASGNIYAAGAFQNTATFGGIALTSSGSFDAYVAKFSTNGVMQWADQLGGPGDDEGLAITVDGAGDVYTTGYFGYLSGSPGSSADFDAGPATYALSSPSDQGSAFISELVQPGSMDFTGLAVGTSASYTLRLDGPNIEIV